ITTRSGHREVLKRAERAGELSWAGLDDFLLLGEVAGDLVAGRLELERWNDLSADLLRLPAPGVEDTTGWRVDRTGQGALEQDPLALLLLDRVGHRHRRHQRMGVGMQRLLVERVPVHLLHDLAEIHDGEAGGEGRGQSG